jgi:hypothetical protein
MRRLSIVLLIMTAVVAALPPSATNADPLFQPPSSPSFSDVGTGHAFYTQVEWLTARNITNGYVDGTFRPTNVVTRQEAAAWLHHFAAYLGDPSTQSPPPSTASFSDVPTSHAFFAEIEWMVAQGITVGFPDGTFRPTDTVTRAALAAYLYRYAGSPAFTPPGTATFSDVPTGHTFYTEIEWLKAEGITNAVGTFSPNGSLVRQAGAAFLYSFSVYFSPTLQAARDCLARSTVIDVNGLQTTQYSGPTLATNSTTDARDANWLVPDNGSNNHHNYPVFVQGADGSNLCFVGGSISQVHDHLTDSWHTWKEGTGMLAQKPDFTVVGTTLFDVGDGFRFSGSASDWTIRGARVGQAHDDCIENDTFHEGLIDDSYFESCYVFLSAAVGKKNTNDATGKFITITNSLVRLTPMTFDDEGNSPGMGPLWKMGNGVWYGGPDRRGRSPDLAVHNTIFRIDARPTQGGKLGIPSYDSDQNGTLDTSYLSSSNCSNNIIVLAGTATLTQVEEDSYDAAGCFTILTGQAGLDAWNARVAAWELTH